MAPQRPRSPTPVPYSPPGWLGLTAPGRQGPRNPFFSPSPPRALPQEPPRPEPEWLRRMAPAFKVAPSPTARPERIQRDPKMPGYPIKSDSDYLKWRGQRAPFPERPISPMEQQMLDIIVRGEVEKDDRIKRFASSYDVPEGYSPTPKPLTRMSIDEVMELQRQRSTQTAMGGFQIKDEQLQEAKAHIPLKGSHTFDHDLQVKVIMDRFYWRRRYADFLAGLIEPTMFQEELAKDFASVERPGTGKSRYGGQPAKTKTRDILPTLEALQKERAR